ncbi:MAG: helix-turn-helix domain-containing protein [Clostridiales bacterium]|nr:helix-turn-helix domain-containing protein [Clostridiales bacterium]
MKMLAANLKLLREQHELTQKQVADALNIERSTYTYYERGRTLPTFATIYKLSKIFKVSIDALAGVSLPSAVSQPEGEQIYGGDDDGILFQEPSLPPIYRVKSPLASLPDEEKGLLLKFRQLSAEKKEELLQQLDKCLEDLDME